MHTTNAANISFQIGTPTVFDLSDFDYSQSGKRIKLIKTNDPYTQLIKGDLGIVEYIIKNHGLIEDQISIKWDSGSNLMLLVGRDNYIIYDEV